MIIIIIDLFTDCILYCFAYNMSENTEKCWSQFHRAQDGISLILADHQSNTYKYPVMFDKEKLDPANVWHFWSKNDWNGYSIIKIVGD